MRHIDIVGEVCRECGIRTLRGFRRFWSVMNFFVVRTSHIDSTSKRESSEALSDIRRFLVFEDSSFFCATVLMCLRSALEALSVYSALGFSMQNWIWSDLSFV